MEDWRALEMRMVLDLGKGEAQALRDNFALVAWRMCSSDPQRALRLAQALCSQAQGGQEAGSGHEREEIGKMGAYLGLCLQALQEPQKASWGFESSCEYEYDDEGGYYPVDVVRPVGLENAGQGQAWGEHAQALLAECLFGGALPRRGGDGFEGLRPIEIFEELCGAELSIGYGMDPGAMAGAAGAWLSAIESDELALPGSRAGGKTRAPGL